jgi:hypothetical protein
MVSQFKGPMVSVEEEDLDIYHSSKKLDRGEDGDTMATVQKRPISSSSEKEESSITLCNNINSSQLPQAPKDTKGQQNSLSSERKGSEAYIKMLVDYDNISFKFKLSATCSLWLLLSGFILFSGTFKLNTAEEILISKIENIPMLVFGSLFCGISSIALIYLSFRWKDNSIWLVERILLYVPFIVL